MSPTDAGSAGSARRLPPGFDVRGIARALRLLAEGSGRWMALSALLLAAQSALPALSLVLLRKIVDAAGAVATAGFAQANREHLVVLLAAAAAVAVAATVLRSLASFVEAAEGQAVTDHVQDALHAQSTRVDLAYYEQSEHLDGLHRAQQEAPLRPPLILNALLRLVRSGVFFLSVGAVLLVSLGWLFPLALLATAAPIVVLKLRHADEMYRWHKARTATDRRILYLNWVLTGNTSHAKEVRLFDLGAEMMDRSRSLRRRQREERLAISGKRTVVDIAAGACETAVIFGAFALLALRAASGVVSVGALVMLYQALQRGRDYLQDILSAVSDLYQHNLFLSSFYEFLELEPRVTDPVHPRPFPERLRTGLEVDRASFRYQSCDRDVLREVSFAARPGEVVALVGANGAGKTSLVRLLCRLYDPTAGSIRIDGIDLRDMALRDLRSRVSVLFQDYAQYFFTARDNIRLGDAGAVPDEERIESAARASGARAVLRALPHGLDTRLGRWLDRGEELSTGQWKRLALARALYRRASLYVFDEPFDAMDPRTENRLIRELRLIARDSVVLVISHRMAVSRWADKVVVLRDGRVVQNGSHRELLQTGGEYRELYERQARHYLPDARAVPDARAL